jgi:hypothetical protein
MLSSQEKKHPINIDPDVADKFKNLRTDIQKFSSDFLLYLEAKKQELEAEATRLQNLLTRLKSELDVYVLCSICFNSSILKFFLQAQRPGILSHISQNYLESEYPLV